MSLVRFSSASKWPNNTKPNKSEAVLEKSMRLKNIPCRTISLIMESGFISLRIPSCKIVVALTMAAVASVAPSNATIFPLIDGDSSVMINDATGSGSAYNWTVGGVNHLNSQWLYYRIGTSGPEAAIDTISGPSSVLNDPKTLTTTYANSLLSVQVRFLLADSANPGQSSFNQEVTINNLSLSPMVLNFFQYSDYNLGGDATDSSVNVTAIGGKYRKAVQVDGAYTLTEIVNPTPGATIRTETALFNQTLTSLTDGSTTTLNNDSSEALGNLTYAFQWTYTVAAGGSVQISKLQEITVVPEPTALAIFTVAGLLFASRGRKHKE